MRRAPPAAVLFDCDGVLADSEPVVNAMVAEDVSARGWPLTAEEARHAFIGLSLPAMVPIVEARTGRPLPPGWAADFSARIAARMAGGDLPAIPGAAEAVRALLAAGVPVACASNSGRAELAAKLAALGLSDAFAGRAVSHEDVPRPKPHADAYLAAARLCGAAPADCVVVEDSATGARSGAAAGCRVLGFSRDTDPALLRAAGAAETFDDMADLPRLLGLLAEAAA